ncbi:MAG: SCO1664 family protein [Chloroflexota bacterium]
MNEEKIITHLQNGTIEMDGYVPWGSNYTVVVTSVFEGQEMQAVYKPRQGERPLWDFPSGTLCYREYCAYLVSNAAGWDVVPPTVLVEGPKGLGSLQAFVPHDPNVHFFNFENKHLLENELRTICLFDLIINNADRKGGHIIQEDHEGEPDYEGNGRLWAIDHGIAFHDEPKLRSVVWDYAEEPIAKNLLEDLEKLEKQVGRTDEESLGCRLAPLLSRREMKAFTYRIKRFLNTGVFPHPGPGRPYPWPMV